MRWINVVPLFPDRISDMTDKAVAVSKQTGFTDFALMLPCHAEGKDPMDKIRFYAPLFGEYRRQMDKEGLKAGILFQTTVGHSNVHCRAPLPFEHAVTNYGAVTRWCMLDNDYRAYLKEAIACLMKQKPHFTLVDDDFRMTHGGDECECFCPIHTNIFNKLNNTNYTPEALREEYNRSAFDSDFRRAFRKLQEATLTDTAQIIRNAIDQENPEAEAIYCVCGSLAEVSGKVTHILAGKHATPALRLSNSMYLEPDMKLLPARMLRAQFFRIANADVPEILDESDTCPHNRFSKCVNSLDAHITAAILIGATGAKLWLTPTPYWEDELDKPYYSLFERKKIFWNALQNTLKDATPVGVNVAVNNAELLTEANWVISACSFFGIPVKCDPADKGGILTLAGENAARLLSKDEKLRLLEGNLLLDGPAADVFCKDGLAELLGVSAHAEDYSFSQEIGQDNLPLDTLWARFPKIRLSDPNPKAEILSRLIARPFHKAPEQSDVAPGCTLFQNPRGGRVAVTARRVDMKGLQNYMVTPRVKRWLIHVLELLDPELVKFVFMEDQQLYAQRFTLADGRTLLSVFNLSYDPIGELPLRTSAHVTQMDILDGDGSFKSLPFDRNGELLQLKTTIQPYGYAIIRVTE